MRVRNCHHCDALWAQYEKALAEQMSSLDHQHQAMQRGDREAAESCELRLHDADLRRAEAFKNLVEHRWITHSRFVVVPDPNAVNTDSASPA